MAGPKQTYIPLFKQPTFVRLVFVALLGEIGYAVLNISTMPVFLRDDRHLSVAVVGLVLVAYLFSEALFKSPMGQLADRIGPRKLMAIGPLLSVFTSLLSFVVPRTGGHGLEVLMFMGLRAIDGLGAAMLWPAAFARVGDSVKDSQRQEAMSVLNLCYMVGIALALPIGGAFDDLANSHSAALFLAAGLFAAVSAAAFFGIPDVPHSAQETRPNEGGLKDLIASLHRIPVYLILAAVTFIGIGFPMAIIKLFAQDQFNMSETGFGALVFPAALVMAFCSVPLSKFGEKIGRIKSVHFGTGLCSIGLVVIGLGAFFPFLRTPAILALGAIPVGVGFLLAIPAWYASVSELDPLRRGANIGAVMTAQGLGAIIGAPLGGLVYDKFRHLGHHLHLGNGFAHYMPFVGSAICVSAGWILSLKILHKPKVEPDYSNIDSAN